MNKIVSSEDEYEARLAYYQKEAKRDTYQPDNYPLSNENNENNELTEEVPF